MSESLSSLDDDLDRVPNLSKEEVMEYLGSKLPILIDCLKNCSADPADAVKSSCILFDLCLPNFESISKAEKVLLSSALPLLGKLFDEIYSNIAKQLQSRILEVVDGLLQVLVTLVGCTKNCVQFYINFKRILASDMNTFNKSIFPLVLKMLDHCSNSKTIYESCAETYAEDLSCLFKEVGDVVLNLTILFRDVVNFNVVEREYEIDIFAEVAHFFGDVSRLSQALNIRVMTESWKMYSLLVGKHAEKLVPLLNVDGPISHLCKAVVRFADSSLDEAIDDKAAERVLKIAGFMLRLLVSLLENGFSKTLKGSLSDVFQLLTTLQSWAEPVLLLSGNKITTRKQLLNRQLVVGVSSIVATLVGNKHFSQLFYSSQIHSSKDEPLSELFLINIVLQEASNCPQDVRQHWLKPEENILSFFMKLIDMCPLAFVQITPDSSVYEMCLSSICEFCVSLSSEEFPIIEHTLLSTLCNSPSTPWPWIFVSDLWVCLIRSSSPSTCIEQIKTLKSLVKQMHEGPQRKMILSLISRLCKILPPNTKEEMNSELSHHEQQRIEKDITKFIQSPSDQTYFNCLLSLDLICEKKAQKKILDPLFQLLPFCQDGADLGEQIGIKVLNACVHCAELMENQHLETVLTQFPFLFSASVRMKSNELILRLTSKTLDNDHKKQTVIRLMSEAFNDLLQNFNPLVQEAALQTFATFAHCSPHEEVVPMAVAKSKDLQSKVSAYIQKQTCPSNVAADKEIQRLSKIKRAVLNEMTIEAAAPSVSAFGLQDDDFFNLDEEDEILVASQASAASSGPHSPVLEGDPEEVLSQDVMSENGGSQEPGFSSDSQASAKEQNDGSDVLVAELCSLVDSTVKIFRKEKISVQNGKKISSAILKLQGLFDEPL